MDDEPLYKRIIKAPRAVTPNEAFNDRVLLIQTFKKEIPVNGSDFISRKAINEEMRKEINARFKNWDKKITVAEIATLIFDVIELSFDAAGSGNRNRKIRFLSCKI